MYEFVTAFARLQPPTIAHEKTLIAKMKEVVQKTGGDGRLYLSPSHGDKFNPLDFATKHSLVKRAFEDLDVVVSEIQLPNMFAMLDWVAKLGYSHVHVVVGDDRLSNGLEDRIYRHLDQFKVPFVTVHNCGIRNDSDEITGMSATKMREWAKLNDYASFESGLPSKLRPMSSDILTKVREACLSKSSATS